MTEISRARVQRLFQEVLAPLAEDLHACVIDGGTDTGVMQMMGQARTQVGGTFPLVGVAPVDAVALPGDVTSKAEPLQPEHTHFVLVPGSQWGDESPWQARIASTLATSAPSVTVLVNGGAIALVDVQENIKAGRPIVVVAGSGRLADEIAETLRQPDLQAREDVVAVVREGSMNLFDLTQPIHDLGILLRQILLGEDGV